MKLIIAEKPSVARDIAATLGKVTRKTGYLEAGPYTVTYAVGHLIGLADADAYSARYKSWQLADLPIVPVPFSLAVLSHAKAQYQVVARLMRQANEVIVATDAGREGQLIYEWIAQHVGYRGVTKRLWLSSLTTQAIREAFLTLRDNRDYQPLYEAALSRAEADWLVGINATRCLTLQAGQLLPVGRVQTPTLAMIVARDQAIASFVPEPYYEVVATFASQAGTYRGLFTRDGQSRLSDRQEAVTIVDRVSDQPGTVARVETKQKNEAPPQLFDLTSLQRRANQLFGMTADQTLKAAQALYEKHKLITYPRTDSRYVSHDIAPTLPARLKAAASLIQGLAPLLESVKTRPGPRVIQDAKVTDHHALLPTDKLPGSTLGGDERKIYELIARQTFAALLPEAKWSHTVIETVVEGLSFITRGKTLRTVGWRAALKESAERAETLAQEEDGEQSNLPPLKRTEVVATKEAQVQDKQTKPPAHFTEATLLSAMESAGKQIDNQELQDAMKERGLGTPATRAATIEKLKRDGLITTQKKQLTATAKGHQLIAAIPVAALKSPELTGEWELKLKQIEKGQYARQTFMTEIARFTRSLITELASQALPSPTPQAHSPRKSRKATDKERPEPIGKTAIPDSDMAPLGQCPLCGAPVAETAKAYGCSAWRTGCTLTIWKQIAGHTMQREEVSALVSRGLTDILTFTSKAGKPFRAQLKLSPQGTVEFAFVR